MKTFFKKAWSQWKSLSRKQKINVLIAMLVKIAGWTLILIIIKKYLKG